MCQDRCRSQKSEEGTGSSRTGFTDGCGRTSALNHGAISAALEEVFFEDSFLQDRKTVY